MCRITPQLSIHGIWFRFWYAKFTLYGTDLYGILRFSLQYFACFRAIEWLCDSCARAHRSTRDFAAPKYVSFHLTVSINSMSCNSLSRWIVEQEENEWRIRFWRVKKWRLLFFFKKDEKLLFPASVATLRESSVFCRIFDEKKSLLFVRWKWVLKKVQSDRGAPETPLFHFIKINASCEWNWCFQVKKSHLPLEPHRTHINKQILFKWTPETRKIESFWLNGSPNRIEKLVPSCHSLCDAFSIIFFSRIRGNFMDGFWWHELNDWICTPSWLSSIKRQRLLFRRTKASLPIRKQRQRVNSDEFRFRMQFLSIHTTFN